VSDVLRGVNTTLFTNLTIADDTTTGRLTSFDSDGFSLGSDTQYNASGDSYVAWNWKANGAGVSNTDGSITSTVSANVDAGFSIASLTTPTSGSFTFGHGLEKTPDMVIFKRRSNTSSWGVWHKDLSGGTYYVLLDGTTAEVNDSTVFNGAPTSSVVSLGSSWSASGAQTAIAYCFHSVSQFSKAFSYTGNGSTDGSLVFLDFQPAWILLKRTDSTGNWTIIDTEREGYNVDNDPLYPNLSNAEGTTNLADILSNGFKLRTTDASVNASGGTYIGFAIAKNPLKYSNAR